MTTFGRTKGFPLLSVIFSLTLLFKVLLIFIQFSLTTLVTRSQDFFDIRDWLNGNRVCTCVHRHTRGHQQTRCFTRLFTSGTVHRTATLLL